nr:hypothetical protein [Alphaproteobacteria bacterium]
MAICALRFGIRSFAAAAGIAASLLLAGCEVRQASVDPSGRLNVLGSGMDLADPRVAAEWSMAGADAADGPTFTPTEIEGVSALRVTSGRQTGFLHRRTDAIVAVAPDLSWAWDIEAHGGKEDPGRIGGGFQGGNPQR